MKTTELEEVSDLHIQRLEEVIAAGSPNANFTS